MILYEALLGTILALAAGIAVLELVAPRTAVRLRWRLVKNDAGYKAEVRDAFDRLIGGRGPEAGDNPRVRRNVRMLGAVLLACTLGLAYVFLVLAAPGH